MTEPPTDVVEIATARNGPYLVTGPVTVKDHDGTPITVAPGSAVALCRCGQSANKPFCDGSHATVGFDGTNHASNRVAP